MNAHQDGGPAFPQPATSDGHACNTTYGIAGDGMTLRDYFAAKAMQAIVSKPECRNYESNSITKDAYMLADAMLVERVRD